MKLLDLIFPKKCLECGAVGVYICGNCEAKVKLLNPEIGGYCIFKYEGVIRRALISIKYKFIFDIADTLADVAVKQIKSFNLRLKNVTLVPIPLHRYKYNFRGFNQADILGQKIAEKMKWEYMPDLLIRTKNTPQQVGLHRQDRLKNMLDVFVVNSDTKLKPSSLIVVFDDVYTTGATLKEAIKVLKLAGYGHVYYLTVARG